MKRLTLIILTIFAAATLSACSTALSGKTSLGQPLDHPVEIIGADPVGP